MWVHTEQELLDELYTLRARVAELEQALEHRSQGRAVQSTPLAAEQPLPLDAPSEQVPDPETSVHAYMRQVQALEVIFETMADGLAVHDKHGRLIITNAAFRRLLAIDVHPEYFTRTIEARGQMLRLADENDQPLPPERWPVRRTLNGEVLSGDHVMDIILYDLNGRKLQVEVSGAPLRDGAGSVIGAVTIYRDVTQRRRSELALFEINRRMDEFLSIASHEIRTPLTTISGNIQLAGRRVKALLPPAGAESDDAAKLAFILDLLGRAERQVRVQNRLVGDLLDISRIQANRLELSIKTYDLVTIVHDAVEDQRAAASDRQITLEELPDGAPLLVEVDADRISQVVANFLTNALKYSPAASPVVVNITREAASVRVSVRDEGPGIPVQLQERVWQRFYRVPGIVVQGNAGAGLGLGLHICRTIIELHHGQIGVQSQPGAGSTFWFSLPLA